MAAKKTAKAATVKSTKWDNRTADGRTAIDAAVRDYLDSTDKRSGEVAAGLKMDRAVAAASLKRGAEAGWAKVKGERGLTRYQKGK